MISFLVNQTGENKLFMDFLERSKLFQNSKDENFFMQTLETSCAYYRTNGLSSKCLDQLKTAKVDARFSNSSSFIFDLDFKIALNLDLAGNFSESQKLTTELLSKADSANRKFMLPWLHNHLGIIDFHIGNFEESKKHLTNADEIFRNTDLFTFHAVYPKFTMLNFYMFSKDFKSANDLTESLFAMYKNFYTEPVETTHITTFYKIFLLFHFNKHDEAEKLLKSSLAQIDEKSDYKVFKHMFQLLGKTSAENKKVLMEKIGNLVGNQSPMYKISQQLSQPPKKS